MKKQIFRGALIAAILVSTAAVAQMGGGAPANSSGAAKSSSSSSAVKVGKAVGVPLTEAQKSMSAGDYPSALISAKLAQAVPDQNPYETYTINKFLSIIYINMKDYPNADVAVEAAADSDAMPDEDKKDICTMRCCLAANAQAVPQKTSPMPRNSKPSKASMTRRWRWRRWPITI